MAEPVHNSTIATGYGSLLKNSILADVTFFVGEHRSPAQAHKAFLASASVVFKEMFIAEPSKTEFEILNIEPVIFEIILQYIYNQNITQYLRQTQYAISLLNAGRYYRLSDLVDQAKGVLMKRITKKTCLEIFKLAVLYKEEDLEKSTLKEICNWAHEIVDSEEFTALDMEHLERIVGLDDLRVKSEIQLFEALIRWAEAECKRQGTVMTPKYCRSYLEKIIPMIRFPQMSESEFASRVAFQGILSRDERGDMALYYKIQETERSEARLTELQFNFRPRKYHRVHRGIQGPALLVFQGQEQRTNRNFRNKMFPTPDECFDPMPTFRLNQDVEKMSFEHDWKMETEVVDSHFW